MNRKENSMQKLLFSAALVALFISHAEALTLKKGRLSALMAASMMGQALSKRKSRSNAPIRAATKQVLQDKMSM